MSKKAIYPGTFDPLTFGHLDLIKRGLKVSDELIVAVAVSMDKAPLFSLEERLKMLKEATKDLKRVTVESFEGLIIEYAKKKHVTMVIRGLRMISDFEYEFQMALTNRKIEEGIETVFMMPNESYSYLSSKLIKEVARLGGDLKAFVPGFVEKRLKEKYRV